MRGSGYGKRDVRGGFRGAAGVAIAGGAREGWLIVVGCNGPGQDSAGGVGKIDAFNAGVVLRKCARVGGYEGGGLFVAGEIGTHLGIVEGGGGFEVRVFPGLKSETLGTQLDSVHRFPPMPR